MSFINTVLNSLPCRCVTSVMMGVAVVTAFVALLSLYGTDTEVMPETANLSMPFPENEKMLNEISNQLIAKDRSIAEGLDDIAPAAGQ